MRKYRVNVNGTAYHVELEELMGTDAAAAASVRTPAPAQTSAPAPGENVTAPMSGTILSVHVAAGDVVRKGQVLMILEAMKMENEIVCPRDGKIAAVSTTEGATVQTGTQLCVIQ